ncbi:MAG: hypothetical protein AAGH15_01085 [Myxococcota bacterium]
MRFDLRIAPRRRARRLVLALVLGFGALLAPGAASAQPLLELRVLRGSAPLLRGPVLPMAQLVDTKLGLAPDVREMLRAPEMGSVAPGLVRQLHRDRRVRRTFGALVLLGALSGIAGSALLADAHSQCRASDELLCLPATGLVAAGLLPAALVLTLTGGIGIPVRSRRIERRLAPHRRDPASSAGRR